MIEIKRQSKTIGDILERPMFLCMLCDSETDFRLCDECITKTDTLEVYR